jgi:hypothetical protein
MITAEILVDLAQEVEITDPIDWGMLSISEEEAYKLITSHIVELSDNPLTLKAMLTKLMVENFVLNLKLLKIEIETSRIPNE